MCFPAGGRQLPELERIVALNSEFYLARADECALEAQSTKLANVRDRSRRAEAAWRAMADQSAQRETERNSQLAEKAAKLEEPALEQVG